ncbi:MAG: pyrB, partial [Gammaproteobacteria bacterium]|nr:pyrB [Gammaproteobacteria bacterium]
LSNCLSIKLLTSDQIYHILDTAASWVDHHNQLLLPPPLLKNKTVAHLFFEKSTRTRCSFELAAKRLGAYVLNFDSAGSSTGKGETFLDTIDNLQAMGVDLFVIRHPETGACQEVAHHLGDRAAVINAGDGEGEHPTQALLDMFTIRHYKRDFSQLSIAIIGDVLHSRVAHSNVLALKTLGVKDIRLVGPPALLPEKKEVEVTHHHDMLSGIKDVDVVMALRLQRERMKEAFVPHPDVYFKNYGLTEEKLKHAKPEAIVMHPGPMNRGVEIESNVAEGSQSVILSQAKYGVAVRMAIMSIILSSEEAE